MLANDDGSEAAVTDHTFVTWRWPDPGAFSKSNPGASERVRRLT